jgi:hypothetical protein
LLLSLVQRSAMISIISSLNWLKCNWIESNLICCRKP